MQAAVAYQMDELVDEKTPGVCSADCPTECPRRRGNRCYQYSGSIKGLGGIKTGVNVWLYCPHVRERVINFLVERGGEDDVRGYVPEYSRTVQREGFPG